MTLFKNQCVSCLPAKSADECKNTCHVNFINPQFIQTTLKLKTLFKKNGSYVFKISKWKAISGYESISDAPKLEKNIQKCSFVLNDSVLKFKFPEDYLNPK